MFVWFGNIWFYVQDCRSVDKCFSGFKTSGSKYRTVEVWTDVFFFKASGSVYTTHETFIIAFPREECKYRLRKLNYFPAHTGE